VNARTRPVHLDLLRIRLPLPGWVSILHRLSGALLFLAVPLAVGLLAWSLSDEAGFWALLEGSRHPAARVLALALFWAFAFHFFAGLRHLAQDAHWGVGLRAARRSGLAVIVASVAATLAFAVWLLA
jgi:succinate dehydrogenase / fumarate reductase cytochrome b subunit